MAKKVTKKTTTKKAKNKTTKKVTQAKSRSQERRHAVTRKTVSPAKQAKAFLKMAAQLQLFTKGMENLTVSFEKFCKTFDMVIPADADLNTVMPAGKVIAAPVNTQAKTEMFDPVPITEPTNGAATITKEQVTQALQEVGATIGMPKVKEILDTVKAHDVSSIEVAKYSTVIGLCKPATTGSPEPASEINLFQ